MLIDFVPTVGGVSTLEAPAFKKAPGGAPAIVAVGISRLGGSSAFIGKVPLNSSLPFVLQSFILWSPIIFLPIVMANVYQVSVDEFGAHAGWHSEAK